MDKVDRAATAGSRNEHRIVMDFAQGKLCRPPFELKDPQSLWGTLGEPAAGADRASLLHLFRSPCAMLRHAFYAPGVEVPLHRHSHASFVYGDGGPCCEIGPFSARPVGRLTFRPEGYVHALRYEGPTDVLTIEVMEDLGPLPDVSIALPAILYDEVWKILTAVALGHPHDGIDEAVSVLIATTRSIWRSPYPDWLIAALERMHRDWGRPPSATALATAAGLSTAYFCRGFKRWMGVTAGQYGRMLRVDRARHMLWSTNAPMSQIAVDTGFADQSHLCRVLKASSAGSRPGGLRAIRPDRLEPPRYSVTDAGRRLRGTRFVGPLT